jgi:hypothetical protein
MSLLTGVARKVDEMRDDVLLALVEYRAKRASK